MSNNIFGKIGTLLLLITVCYFFSPHVAYGQDEVYFVRVKVKLVKEDENKKIVPLESPSEFYKSVEICNMSMGKVRYHVFDDGEVNIPVVHKNKLRFSLIGFKPQTIKIKKSNLRSGLLEVKLLAEDKWIDSQVVTVSYKELNMTRKQLRALKKRIKQKAKQENRRENEK